MGARLIKNSIPTKNQFPESHGINTALPLTSFTLSL